ncbi:MAG TPA: hypothetical protein VKX17_18155 [Planctomycetota bacterium]|nr:hypothetical protein [Planctomycetota bacterium]
MRPIQIGLCLASLASLAVVAGDSSYDKIAEIIRSVPGTISIDESRFIRQKLDEIGIKDPSEIFNALEKKENVEVALHAIWAFHSHLDDNQKKCITQLTKGSAGKINYRSMGWAFFILLDDENGFKEASRLLMDKDTHICIDTLRWLIEWCEDRDNQRTVADRISGDAFVTSVFEKITEHLTLHPFDESNRNILSSLAAWPPLLKKFEPARRRACITAFYHFDFYIPENWPSTWHLPLFNVVKEVVDQNDVAAQKNIRVSWLHGDSIDRQLYLYAFWASGIGKSDFVRELIKLEKSDSLVTELDLKLSKIAKFETKEIYQNIANLAFRKEGNADRMFSPEKKDCDQ